MLDGYIIKMAKVVDMKTFRIPPGTFLISEAMECMAEFDNIDACKIGNLDFNWS